MKLSSVEVHKLCIEDTSELYFLTRRNAEYLKKWLPWLNTINSMDDTKLFILNSILDEQRGRSINYKIVNDNKIIGNHNRD